MENIRIGHSKYRCGILRFSVSLALLLFSALSNAQEFGGNPPSIDWRQVNTDTVRVIFPAALDSQAREIAGLVHRIAATTGSSLGSSLRKIDIVLQNQPTMSNGYVSLGPFRSEFYMTPRQNSFELGSLPWHKSLALHEYRHVQQYSNFRKGLSRTFYYVFGEEGQALANSLALPDWFWEGDALYQETKMSNQGRGRLPYFFNGYRSLWAAEKNYDWMKLRNGSYRDFVPDHYDLGYMLVNYGYKKYGEQGWKKIADDAVRFRSLFYPFQRSFERNTGQKFKNFREEAFKYFGKDIGETKVDDSASRFAAEQSHFVADELYPQWTQQNKLVYLKSTYKHIPAFYIRDVVTGEEKKIRNKSLSITQYFAYSNNKIVYSVYKPHLRWGWKNYEELAVIDINTGKEKILTHNSRYLSPDISHDGNRIVAVHSGEDGTTRLHIVDAATGKLVQEIPNPGNYVITYPRFFRDFEIVSPVRNGTGEMALASFNTQNGNVNLLTDFTMDVIAFPSVKGDTIFFSRSSGNNDAMFAYCNGNISQFVPAIDNRSTGNYMLTGQNGVYAWSAFTAAGFHILTGKGRFVTQLKNSDRYPVNVPANSRNLLPGNDVIGVPTKKYGALTGLFNFHSWRPYFSDPEYSYSIIGNNILNTFQSELYITYNRNERFKEAGAALSFGGWYPVITGGASYTFDRSFTDSARRNTWNEFNARLGMNVPLNFARGTFSQSLNGGASFNTKQVYYTGATKQFYGNKQFNYGDYFFSFTNQQLKARQHILPRIAQSLFLRYRHILNKYTANQFLVNGNIYLPGLFRNHNVVLQAAYQSRDTLNEYNFSNTFPFSRGYPDIDFPRMWKAGVNYHFPISYPDKGLANIVYLLRLRGNLFYDYSGVKSLRTGRQTSLTTVGTELYFDTKWWNQLPVSIGIRYSRLVDADKLGINANRWEIVLPTNILSR